MQLDTLGHFTITFIELSALLLACVIGGLVLWVVYMYIVDITQKSHAIRRNYPVLGRFRYLFEHLGSFFRQYFFALDREELPFNRAQRSWVYRAAKNIDSTVAFGSTQPLSEPGQVIFLNALLPPLEQEIEERDHIVFGEGFARTPYRTCSFFNISAMSFGALSAPAVQALSRGARQAGVWLNTGEGGLAPYHLQGGCDVVFQIGTAKYGVRDEHGAMSDAKLGEIAAIEQVRMFEIKLSQGAKPGKGGILPGLKVTDIIASTRGIPAGQDSISPNRHPEIDSVDDLLDMIHRVREVTGKPTGIKAVIGQSDWLDDMCQRIHQRGLDYAPDFITVDSGDGGSGAAPQSLIDNMGLPIRRSLPMVADKLNYYGLRDRVRIIASGKLINPTDVATALCLGADTVNSARGFMFSLGCIQAMQCNRNTCPTGVTTHNEELQKGLDPTDKAQRVASYARNLMHEVEVIAHSCGVMHPHLLNRSHAYIVSDSGYPEPMTARFPVIETAPEFQ
ncbi:FMN-binding glutamate synthase family protein [Mangrovimicrobium sediminis]|nr:FMN-binding glutamate synthase family protein [Haliea sp. SAOS-164]